MDSRHGDIEEIELRGLFAIARRSLGEVIMMKKSRVRGLFACLYTVQVALLMVAVFLYSEAAMGADPPHMVELGTFEGSPNELFVHGGNLYFAAPSGVAGNVEPWFSNGTPGVTRPLGELTFGDTGSFPHSFQYARANSYGGLNRVLFLATDRNLLHAVYPGGPYPPEVYQVPDGVNSLLRTFYDVEEYTADFQVAISAVAIDKGMELMVLNPPFLWAPYTAFYRDINLGPEGSFPREIVNASFRHDGDWVPAFAFSADDGTHGREYVVFKAPRVDSYWHNVFDLRPGAASSTPQKMLYAESESGSTRTVYFTADDGTHGRELWRDNCAGNVVLVKDINPGSSGSSIGTMAIIGTSASILFDAFSIDLGRELWISDGTDGGTFFVKDIKPGTIGSFPENLTYSAPFVYFTADDGVHGEELWRSDGSAPGTVMVLDIRPGAASSNPGNLAACGGQCYFTADGDGDGGTEVWVTDGTVAGTHAVMNWLDAGSSPRKLTADETRLFFTEGDTLYALNPEGVPGPAAPENLRGGPTFNNSGVTGRMEFDWDQDPAGVRGYETWIRLNESEPWIKYTNYAFNSAIYVPKGGEAPWSPNAKVQFSVRAYSDAESTRNYSMWPEERYVTACTEAQWPQPGVDVFSLFPLTLDAWHGDDTYAFLYGSVFGDEWPSNGFRCAWNMTTPAAYVPNPAMEQLWETEYFNVSPHLGAGSYYLHMRAVNQCGDISNHVVSMGPFHFDFQPPSVPGTPVAGQSAGLQVYYRWTEATDTGSGVASYDCQIGTSPGGNDVFDGNVGNSLVQEFTCVVNETYHARVRAIDAAGNVGAWSPISFPFTPATFGSLKATISPPIAVLSGAQWRRKGTTVWLNSGVEETDVLTGNITVEFKETNGWLRPADKIVTVLENTLATTSGTYVQNGSLAVTIEPAGAVAAGAQWRLFRDPLLPQMSWQNSGQSYSVALGDHLIEFKPVPGWEPPASISVTLSGPGTVTKTGTYTEQETGSLTVEILPEGAVTAGAQWRRSGTETWFDGGATESLVPLGNHTVEFKVIAGWNRPVDQTVTITLGETTEAEGTYELRSGALQVSLLPEEAIAAGAQWRRAERIADPVAAECVNVESTDGPLSCNGSSATSTMEITLPGNITDINLQVDIDCADNSDIEITLYAVNGNVETFPVLSSRLSGQNLRDTVFDDEAAVLLIDGAAPYSGAFRPDTPLADMLGIPATGTWQLVVTDFTADGAGYETVLNNWNLCITTDEMAPSEGDSDGEGPWLGSGNTETGIPVGVYRVEFGPATGWMAPADETVTVALGETAQLAVEYGASGSLTVHLLPAEAVAAGAQWRLVDTETWNDTGETLVNLEPGEYPIEFKQVDGWTTPAVSTFYVSSGLDIDATGLYLAQSGLLQVNIEPAEANGAARWRYAPGGPWLRGGEVEFLPLGNYTIEFTEVPGWTKPASRAIVLNVPDELVTLQAEYSGGCAPYNAADTPLPLAGGDSLISELLIEDDGLAFGVTVLLDITCNSTSALEVRLENPQGIEVILFSELDNDGSNFEQTGFDDDAAESVFEGFAPYSDIYAPQQPLSAFQGSAIAGTWLLTVTDLAGGSVGTLNGWMLCVNTQPEETGIHTADQDGNYQVNLTELLRIIQFFNTGGFHCADPPESTEDGFAPGVNLAMEACATHDSDYNPSGPSWTIDLTELLRLIQFFNTGGYHHCPANGTEDGFCPGLL